MARAIFTFMHGDASVDESPEKAAGGMEAVDVKAGEYEVICDDSGLIYEPRVIEKYQVQLVPTERRDYNDLVHRLRDFGDRAGLNMPVGVTDFPVQAARVIAEWEWSRRWPKRPAWLSRRIHGSRPPTFGSG